MSPPRGPAPASPLRDAPVALITGGARMGRAVGLELLQRGYDTAYSAWTSKTTMDEAAAAIDAHGGCARVFEADLAVPRACHDLVADVTAWRNRLDLLVCFASRFDRVALHDISPAAWRHQLAVDLDASFHCAQAAAAVMRPRGAGQIILSSDWVAASGRPRYTGYVPYYVAKAGVVALTEALALELAPDNIRVNAIAPGPIMPAVGATDQQQRAVMAATPLGHWGGAQAIAQVVGALVDSTFITGEVVRVNGGRHLG